MLSGDGGRDGLRLVAIQPRHADAFERVPRRQRQNIIRERGGEGGLPAWNLTNVPDLTVLSEALLQVLHHLSCVQFVRVTAA